MTTDVDRRLTVGPARTITEGAYDAPLACPDCGQMVSIPAQVLPSLTVEPDGRYLKLKVTSKRVEHRCNGGDADALPFDE